MFIRVAALLLLATLVAAIDQDLEDKQACEMCGLLIHQLETLKASLDEKLNKQKEQQLKDAKRRGVLGRTSRAEMPAQMIDAFETHLESHACGTNNNNNEQQGGGGGGGGMDPSSFQASPMGLASTAGVVKAVCRREGIDDSVLRLPSGIPHWYDPQECRRTVEQMCDYVRREYVHARIIVPSLALLNACAVPLCHVLRRYVDEMIEAAYSGLTATECGEILPGGCAEGRATMLLGPMYGKVKAGTPIINVGMKDVWKKMPGLPPYYLNMARGRSQVEMPEGWDPEGPSEQVIALPVDASASEDAKKDEL